MSEKNSDSQEMKLTYSGFLTINGQRCVSVSFERGEDIAEGTVPGCKITKNKGFTNEEINRLEEYLQVNMDQIMKSAREISSLTHILR